MTRDTYALLVVALALLILGFAKTCSADCTVNWKPGDVTFVEPGRPVTYIIESEDVGAFKHKPTGLPSSLESLGITKDNDVESRLHEALSTHYCGEYRDITDAMLD